MIVRSRIITADDIVAAVRTVPGVTFQNTYRREGWYLPIHPIRGRDGRPAFEFFLAGSSPHRAQHDREEYAATWTEWGIVMAALFAVDPDATIGHYNGREQFIRITERDGLRMGHDCPWLVAA
jgi:hypothetical protein